MGMMLACALVAGGGLLLYWFTSNPDAGFNLAGRAPATPLPATVPVVVQVVPSPQPINPDLPPVTFTATSTSIPTATHPSTATATPADTSQTIAASPTRILALWTPSHTPTLDPNATPTATAAASETTGPSPTPSCDVSTGNNLVFDGKTVSYSLSNHAGGPIVIVSIEIDWDASNGRLEQVSFAGATIWAVGDSSPPTRITDGWTGADAGRTLGADETKVLALTFKENAVNAYYSIGVGFDNGCMSWFSI